MSKENVEVVRGLIPPPDADLAALFRDDELFARAVEALSGAVAPDVQSAAVWHGGGRRTYQGIEGFRQLWLDWLEPWAAYHTSLERIIDADPRVVALIRDRAQRADSDAVVDLRAGSVWEFRDGVIARVEFFRSQDEALAAAGLEA